MTRLLRDQPGVYRSIAILAPMQIELDPIVRRLDLVPEGPDFTSVVEGVELWATLTEIGMAAGARAARRALDRGADLVIVVGIAGAVDDLAIGSLVRPAAVVDRTRRTGFEPWYPAGVDAAGVLSCGDDFIADGDALGALRRAGVVALDMETAAVAAECDRRRAPWTVFRAISDRPGDGLIDPQVLGFTNPDGSANRETLSAYLREDPSRAARLAQLASDTERATLAAAEGAATLVTQLTGVARS